jgi:hypothetical protein
MNQIQDQIMSPQMIHHLKGKYVKRLLSRLEELHRLDPDVRKVILDEFNDFVRELLLLELEGR